MKKMMCALLILGVFCVPLVTLAQEAPSGKQDQGAPPPQSKPPVKKHNLTYEDRKAWHRILKWPDECEQEFERDWSAAEGSEDRQAQLQEWLTFWQLEPHKYLVEVICFLAAYQLNQRYLYYDETKSPPAATLLTFKIYDKVGKKQVAKWVDEFGGFGEFDDRKKELIMSTKFRGLGDCGYRAVYRIKDGKAILKEFRAKFNCDGKEWGPEKAPRIYPR